MLKIDVEHILQINDSQSIANEINNYSNNGYYLPYKFLANVYNNLNASFLLVLNFSHCIPESKNILWCGIDVKLS